jgi:hypothetical protein
VTPPPGIEEKVTVVAGDRSLVRACVMTADARYVTVRFPDPAPVLTQAILETNEEGITWARGWEGPPIEALSVCAALRG